MSLPLKERLTILLFLILIISPYLAISFYTNPVADDLTYAFKGKNFALLPTLQNEYLHWNGRYTSNIFVLINPIAYNNFILYKLAPILLIFLTVFSYFFFISALCKAILGTLEILCISIALCILFLYQMPLISEGIYWYTGAVTYQLGNIVFLLYLGTLVHFFKKNYLFNSSVLHLMLLSILLLLAIGFNEIVMIVILLVSTTMLIINLTQKLHKTKILLYLLGLSILGACIVYFAPGNATRESFCTNNHRFIYSVTMSIAQTGRFVLHWMSSLPLILLSILYYPLNKTLSKQISVFKNSFYLNPVMAALLPLIITFLAAFLPYWSTGILGQHRTMNVAYFLFIVAWFINLTVYYNWLQPRLEISNKKFRWILYCFIGLSFMFTKNGFNLIEDIAYGKARNYNAQMQNRYRIVSESALHSNKDTICLELIQSPPKTLFVLDITNDPQVWQNKSYCVFFTTADKKIVIKEE